MESAIFGLIGVVIGLAASMVRDHFNRKAQEQMNIKQLALKLATHEHRAHIDLFISKGGKGSIDSLAAYLGAAYCTVDSILRTDITQENAQEIFEGIRAKTRTIIDAAECLSPRRGKAAQTESD